MKDSVTCVVRVGDTHFWVEFFPRPRQNTWEAILDLPESERDICVAGTTTIRLSIERLNELIRLLAFNGERALVVPWVQPFDPSGDVPF